MKKPKYKFDKKKHFHSLDDKPLFGTTTALSVIAKPFLIPWASKMCSESIKKEWKIGKAYTREERDAILEKGRKAHHEKKKAGGDVGTIVHKEIEKWIKKGCPNVGYVVKGDSQVQDMFVNFRKWTQDNNVEFLFSEKNVHSEKYWFGGIVDFVCMIDGKKFVGDIKTSSGIFPEHFLQMGAYDICLQELGHEKADGYVIVNLQKSGVIKIKKFTTTKKFQDAFIHALELYKILKTMKWNNYY